MEYNKEKILNKIDDKSAVVAVIGLGYVGLPLSLAFAEAGYKVIGIDNDKYKIESLLKNKQSYIKHISQEKIKDIMKENCFDATVDLQQISNADVIIICLPTPLNRYKEPDLSYVTNTMDSILPYLKEGQILSLESTTYPGTTEEELQTRIENEGFIIGENFFLVYSPEREDPGNLNFNTKTIPKVVGGITTECLEVGIAIYGHIIEKIVPVSSTKAAELTKLLENIYRSVNIGLVNEMKIVADKMGIDIWEVINAASTKPFGFKAFYPGPGWGGHCIPIDPFYLTWKAKEYNINTKFIELSGELNTMMPQWVVNKMMDALNDKEKSLKNSNVLILGLAYKKNIDDTRESPSVKLMEVLHQKGAIVHYADPFVSKFPKMREHYFELEAIEVNKENLDKMDCVLISTSHDSFDYEFILNNSDLIVDTRGVYKEKYVNVIKA